MSDSGPPASSRRESWEASSTAGNGGARRSSAASLGVSSASSSLRSEGGEAGTPSPPASRGRRKASRASASSSTTPGGSPPSTATSFLSRFVSTFRPSTSVEPRPPLPRSLSTPTAPPSSAATSTSVPPVPNTLLLADYARNTATRSTSSFNKRFRPAFNRRATEGSPAPSPAQSPPGSPALSNDSTSSQTSSPTLSAGKERNPMDSIGSGGGSARTATRAIGGSTGGGVPGSVAMGKRGSVTSQMTVLPGEVPTPRSPGPSLPSPLGLSDPPINPLASSSTISTTSPKIDDPLAILTSLLPPALLLLSYFGPGHLFSPPMNLPAFETLFSPLQHTNSSNSTQGLSSDRSSISSSRTSDSVPSVTTLPPRPPCHTHELYAPSTVSVPAVSAAAVWRLFRGFEWLGALNKGEENVPEAGKGPEDAPSEQAFDFPALLQGSADVLAAKAASRGVELVIGQVGSGSLPSPIQTLSKDPFASDAKPKEVESRELLVRGDERAWGVALVWILANIIKSTSPGATIEVHFLATAASRPSYAKEAAQDSQGTIPTRKALDVWWTISLEVLHTLATSSSDAPTPPSPPPSLFSSSLAQSLLNYFHIRLGAGPSAPGTQAWILETTLPGARPHFADPDDPSTLLGRRRASLEMSGQEPTIDDLKRFAELGLKGTRVALHSGEQSTFAKHLTTYLAGWGMDVSHVPLDRDDSDSTASKETVWNKGRREQFSRFDSGFGGSSGTEGHSPSSPFELHNPPLKHLPSDSSSRSSTTDTLCPLIVIDDDVLTLRRLLYSLRPGAMQAPAPSLISKRPQLATRRTRSSPHVRQLHQLPQPPPPGTVIIHFASLTQYKAIKELVQDVLATSRSPSLPDVLVIPKPAGPRRIITALWTALKRPAVDPSLPPIATSPTSPGVQYWTPRLSPALMNQQDFDSAAAEALSAKDPITGAPKPRTPPVYFPQPTGMPPSPLGKISDDQVSYFSVVAENLNGTTPSEGMVIQSPDGRPGIFFQPQVRGSRVSSAKGKAATRAIEREADVPEDKEDGRPNVAAPHEIGLGHPSRRTSSSAASSAGEMSPVPIGTPALTLDSFIAKSRGQSADNSPDAPDTKPETPLTRQTSSTGVPSRPPSTRPNVSSSPRVAPSVPRRSTSGPSPPLSPELGHGGGGSSGAPTPPQRISTAIPPPSRRGSGLLNSPHGRRKNRRTTLPTVPPICVLIVEDNPINQTILSMFMKKKGIKYDVAKDGEEAVQKWKRGSFHLVLMDIQLPVKDGIEATREIRDMERANNIGTFITTPPTSDPNSPTSPLTSSTLSSLSPLASPLLHMPVIIVALTASSLQADRVNALAAGCNDFLTKPVSLPWLQQKLLEWGSMAYLSGFSRMTPGSLSGSKSGAFSSASLAATGRTSAAGFVASIHSSTAAETISQHLHIDPRPHARGVSPGRPTESTTTGGGPALTVSSPTPVLTPAPIPATSQSQGDPSVVPDLSAVDDRLEGLRRPGPSPLAPQPPSLESVVAEGALWAEASRSRANSATADSFSHVMHSSHGAAGSPLVAGDGDEPSRGGSYLNSEGQ